MRRVNSSRLALLTVAILSTLSFLFLRSRLSSRSPSLRKNKLQKIQYDFDAKCRTAGELADESKAKAVRSTMQRTFWTYHDHAWGADEIKPRTGGSVGGRNGWGATLVDMLTTLAVMRLDKELKLCADHIHYKVDFRKADGLVDPFETTIRYLGSLVSTVELANTYIISPDLVLDIQPDQLLNQAETLSSKLAPSFDSPSGLLWPRVNFTTNQGCREPFEERQLMKNHPHALTDPARSGSNFLENRVLSELTGDPIYAHNATRAWASMVWNKNDEEWPGIIDGPLDIVAGSPVARHRSWGAGHDSYYEYLLKAHILSPFDHDSETYASRWIQAVESTIKYFASWSQPSVGNPNGHMFLLDFKDPEWPLNEMSHLVCFAPGNLILGGKYLSRPDIVDFGLALLDGCRSTYSATETKVGPEKFSWVPSAGVATFKPDHRKARNQVKADGIWIKDARYLLRPETVESYFYAWRITGRQQYRDWAWEAYEAIEEATRDEHGYAAIQDVNKAASGQNRLDAGTESFWAAETLKYLYLTFTDPNWTSLDDWVFSTEGHPFRIIK